MFKILIIEDELDLREMYKIQFETTGAQVFATGDIEEGFKIAKKEKPDVALVDLMIAQTGYDKTETPKGFILLDKLRSCKETKNIKIAVVSNWDTQDIRNEAVKKGVAGFIVKANTTPRDIAGKVRGLVGESGK